MFSLPKPNRSIRTALALGLTFVLSASEIGAQTVHPVLAKAAQPMASRLDLVTAVGLNNRPGLPIDLGLRVGLGAHAALETTFGTPQWGRGDASSTVSVPGGRVRDLRLDAAPLVSASLKAHTRPGRSGLYGSVGVGLQRYAIESQTRFDRESLGARETLGQANDPFVALLGALFGSLLDANNHVDYSRTTRGVATSLQLQAGYAFAFRDGQRLEIGGRVIHRSLSEDRFALGTPDGDLVLPVAKSFDTQTWALEARYVVPLVR